MCKCHKPTCKRKCVQTFTETYKLYQNCCYSLYKVCSCCGHEFDHNRHYMCPSCGAQMGDPPGDPPRGGRGFGGFGRGGFGRFGDGFRRFGGFGRFRDFNKFGRFGFGFPFPFLLGPFDFDDEDEF